MAYLDSYTQCDFPFLLFRLHAASWKIPSGRNLPQLLVFHPVDPKALLSEMWDSLRIVTQYSYA